MSEVMMGEMIAEFYRALLCLLWTAFIIVLASMQEEE